MTSLTVVDVVDKLEALGSSEQIALFLEQEGVKGVRNCPSACAIAEFVGDACGAPLVRVTAQSITAQRFGHAAECAPIYIDGPIIDFILDFDEGRYPELVSGVAGDA